MIKGFRIAIVLVLLGAGSALASPETALHTVGKLAPLKKTEFFTLKYVDRAGKKRKTVKAYVKFDPAATFYFDSVARLDALGKGDTVWLYGEPVEREAQDENGRVQVDRQIVNTAAAAFGDGLEIAKADPKATGSRWIEAEVLREAAQGLSVKYQGGEYKVVLLRGYAVLHRQRVDRLPKLKKKKLVEIVASATDDRPEKAKATERVYAATRIVFLERRLQSVYPLLLR